MQIDIDFQVFKALTTLRESESDSYNAVIRRILNLPTVMPNALAMFADPPSAPPNALAVAASKLRKQGLLGGEKTNALADDRPVNGLLSKFAGGVWYGNVHFPEGTKFRATYKGQTHHAEIKDGRWVDADGIARNSPSEAASTISNTNVNGWRFWFAQLPGDPSWRKLEELKQ